MAARRYVYGHSDRPWCIPCLLYTSNMMNAGIRTVGVVLPGNYRSLVDHLGSGREWELDRKKGGLFLLPVSYTHLPQGEPREDGTWPGPGDPFPAQRGTYYTYDDLSDELVAYVKKMGYTLSLIHI